MKINLKSGFTLVIVLAVAVVVAVARKFKELARSPIGEPVRATPAFVGGRIYVRGKKHLFCIGAK